MYGRGKRERMQSMIVMLERVSAEVYRTFNRVRGSDKACASQCMLENKLQRFFIVKTKVMRHWNENFCTFYDTGTMRENIWSA